MSTATSAPRTGSISSPPSPLPRAGSRTTVVSFPRRWPPTTTALSVSTPPSARAVGPGANPKYHSTKVDAGEEGVDGDELLRRVTREVVRAGVMEEIWRRRRHEDARDERKRKARSASRRFRRRHLKGPYPFDEEQKLKERIADDDENGNWELPGGEFPSYR